MASNFYRNVSATSMYGKPRSYIPGLDDLQGVSPTDVPYTDAERFGAAQLQGEQLQERQRIWEAQQRGALGPRPMSTNTRSPLREAQMNDRMSPAWSGFFDSMSQVPHLAAQRGLKGKVSPIGRSAMPSGRSRELSLDSSYLNSPAVRGLTEATTRQAQGGRGDVNPVLLRHLNDRVAQRALQQLDREIELDTPVFVPAGTEKPGGARTMEDISYRPRDVEASRTVDRERQAGVMDRESLEALNAFFEPQEAARQRDAASRDTWQQAADETGAFWKYEEPIQRYKQGQQLEAIDARAQGALADDQVRADAQIQAALIKAETDRAAGKSEDAIAAELIASLVRSGAFGRTGTGQVANPPANVQQGAGALVDRLMQGSGRRPMTPATPPGMGAPQGAPGASMAPMGGQGGQFPPEIEYQIQRGIQMGKVRTREEAIQYLQGKGFIQ
jgi:hypothetical protein